MFVVGIEILVSKQREVLHLRPKLEYSKTFDPNSVVSTVNNLGCLYRYLARSEEAERMYERALAGREKALDPDHTYTLDPVNIQGFSEVI